MSAFDLDLKERAERYAVVRGLALDDEFRSLGMTIMRTTYEAAFLRALELVEANIDSYMDPYLIAAYLKDYITELRGKP